MKKNFVKEEVSKINCNNEIIQLKSKIKFMINSLITNKFLILTKKNLFIFQNEADFQNNIESEVKNLKYKYKKLYFIFS